MYLRILVPVDGSETSNRALAAAIGLARVLGSRLRLVHVIEEMAYLSAADPMGGSSAHLMEALRQGGEAILRDGLATARAAGVEVDTMLFDTLGEHLADTIAESAKRWNADLIVVGTHGRRGVGRLLMGSGAEQIIRLAPVPVLVVRAAPESPAGSN